MKTKILFAVLPLLFIGKLKAQTLTFDYENGGSQIIRQYCATCYSLGKTSVSEALSSKEEFPPQEYQVKIYPNPTKGKVQLVWSSQLGDMIRKVEYVAYNFTKYREIPFDKTENKALLDLSDQPIGMYVVIFHLNTGEQLAYKVLKH